MSQHVMLFFNYFRLITCHSCKFSVLKPVRFIVLVTLYVALKIGAEYLIYMSIYIHIRSLVGPLFKFHKNWKHCPLFLTLV